MPGPSRFLFECITVLIVIGGLQGCCSRRLSTIMIHEQATNSNPPLKLPANETQESLSSWYHEARLLDIPFPVHTQLVENMTWYDHDTSGFHVGYVTNRDSEFLYQFYMQEMERFGWRFVAWLRDKKGIIVFEKPRRSVVITLQPCSTFQASGEMEVMIYSL